MTHQPSVSAETTHPSVIAPAQRWRWWPQLSLGWGQDSTRDHGLDAARGLALVGMMIVHAAAQGPDPKWLGFALGRSSMLFATIAGVSLAIITGGSRPHAGERVVTERSRILARSLGLWLIGSALTTLGTPIGIILGFYAIWFVLAIPFLRCRVRTLLIWAAALAATGGASLEIWYQLSWEFGLATSCTTGNSFFTIWFSEMYPVVIYMAFVLVGLALGRTGLRAGRNLLIWGGAGLAAFVIGALPFVVQAGSLDPLVGIEAAGQTPAEASYCLQDNRFVECTKAEFEEQSAHWSDEEWQRFDEFQASLGEQPIMVGPIDLTAVGHAVWNFRAHDGSPFQMLSSGGFTLFVICLFSALGRLSRWPLFPLAAMGSMSLTAYSVHVIAFKAFPDAFGGDTNWPLIHLIGSIAAGCAGWALLFRRGPLEQALNAFSQYLGQAMLRPGS